MERDRKKLIVLACLLILWVALIFVKRHQSLGVRPSQAPSVSEQRRSPAAGIASRRQSEEHFKTSTLKLGQVQLVRPRLGPEGRNILAASKHSSAVPAFPPTKRGAASTPRPPLDRFIEEAMIMIRFLGYTEASGKAVAFVTYGNEVLAVAENQTFGGRFRVKEISKDALIVSSLDGTKAVLLMIGAELDHVFPLSPDGRPLDPVFLEEPMDPDVYLRLRP